MTGLEHSKRGVSRQHIVSKHDGKAEVQATDLQSGHLYVED